MKKTLIAAALLAGFAGAAQAETQVTLYGIIDAGVGYQRIKGIDGDSRSKFGVNSGNQSGSRWGLRGTEDLGGGTRAVFTLESGFSSQSGQHTQGGRLFGRQATVGLANDAWGQFDLGRQTNIASKYFGSIDPFGASFGLANIGHGFSSANTQRYDNMVMYQTPSYSGFQLGAGYSFNANSTAGSDYANFRTNDNQRAITAGLRYVNGPLNLAAAYDQINQVSSTNQAKIRSYLVGGSYDFEVVKLALAWGQTRNGWLGAQGANVLGGGDDGLGATATERAFPGNTSASGFRASSYLVGLTVPLGAATNVFGSWQRIDPKNDNLTGGDETSNSYSLGTTYDLSKRTNLYAYGNYTTDYAFLDGVKATTAIVGVRHRF